MNCILNRIWLILPIIMSIITIIVLYRLSEPSTEHALRSNIFINIATGNVIFTIILWVYLYIKTRDLEKTIGLTRDRWHTIYPKTVITIVFSIFCSYTLMCIGAYYGYSMSGVIIVTLIYILVYQTIKQAL